ncbi:MAG: hypothetical protein WA053_01365, partial [Minisyncoccia bacterium]
MDPFTENLITTKDASELSGYTSDYLARLVRSGEISGKRIGHNWLIDNASLGLFLQKQKGRKIDRARELAEARVQEYRARTQTQSASDFSDESLTIESFVPGNSIAPATLSSQVFALVTAIVVVVSGAALARASVLPEFAQRASALVYEASVGFTETFGSGPSQVALDITATSDAMSARLASVAHNNLRSSAQVTTPLLVHPDLSFLHLVTQCVSTSCDTRDVIVNRRIVLAQEDVPVRAEITRKHLEVLASDVFSFVSSPQAILDAGMGTYAGGGAKIYESIGASFIAYRNLIEGLGRASLASAGMVRDSLSSAPRIVAGVGQTIVDATHAVIRADVAATYGLAAAAPASARGTTEFMGTTGVVLAYGASHIPSLAASIFKRATEAPAVLAPALAQAVFDAEYAGAKHFVAFTSGISERYLALIDTSGRIAYASVAGTQTLASALADAPRVIEDAYLGMLGSTALALDTAAHVSPVAAVLVAVAPALSVGEQAALAVYETIRDFFSSTSRTFATLFAPSPATAPLNVPTKNIPVATSTPVRTTTVVRETVNSYPTYTTLVQGVSQDFVRESLSTLRADILATAAGMIQPVAAQGVTNMNTIQYVNMIQDLSNLIVRNGDFRGGTFDSGKVTNGISVSATTGSFTSLTSGATSLGATSVSGDLSVSGTISPATISAGTSISAPYFVATSTAATSTFAGSLGIGTSTPGSLLSIGGSGTGWNFFDNGTTTSYAKGIDLKNGGCFAVNGTCVGGSASLTGTTGQIAYFSGTDTAVGTSTLFISGAGNIGIGTTSPFAKFALAGSAGGTSNLFALSTSTAASATTTALTIDSNGNFSLLNGANLSVSGTLSVTGTSAYSSLATFSNGFLSNASSTIMSGLFSMNGGASTTAFTNSGATWLTSLSASSLLATDANKMLVSTTSIGASNLALAKGNFLVGDDAGVAQATSSIFI